MPASVVPRLPDKSCQNDRLYNSRFCGRGRMRFKLRQMEVFRAVMVAGSVSGAARLLYVSQPAVSKLLAHTETSLGLKLFDRVGGKLIPTAQANSLFEEVSAIYDAAVRINRFVENLTAAPAAMINLSCSPSLGLSVVPRLIRRFLERHPETRIQLQTTLMGDVAQELLSGRSDLAITVLPVENPNLDVEPLVEGRMVCALPVGHPLARAGQISLRQLAGERLILYSRTIPFGQLLRAAFERHDLHVAATIDVPRAELACSLVRQGLGVTIIDQFSVSDQLWTDIELRPLDEIIPISVSLIRSRFARRSQAADLFVEMLRTSLPDLAADLPAAVTQRAARRRSKRL